MKENEIRKLEIEVGINESISSIQCRYCKNIFSRTAYVTRHMKICPCKETYKLELLEKLSNKVNMKKPQTINNNTTNNNCNNTINIHVNSLGNEDMSYITTKTLKKLWNSVRTDEEGVAKTIKMIHGSKDHPENHNIIYTNMRSNVAMVKIDNDFEYKNINEVLKDVSINTLDAIILSTQYDDLSKFIKAKYEKVCEDEEMNKEASIQAKTELYNSYKKGDIKRP